MKTVKIFVSSPSDVALEREIARKLLHRLSYEFASQITIERYLWEDEPMDFSKGYQPQIPLASSFDIVIGIFFTKLGYPLTVDEVNYPSGTAYELIEAKTAKVARAKPGEPTLPHILVFRNMTSVKVDAPITAKGQETLDNLDALDSFLRNQTICDGEFIGAVNGYPNVGAFEEILETKLRHLLKSFLPTDAEQAGGIRKRIVGNPRPINPYRGLFAFEFEQAADFFGRSTASSSIVGAFQSQDANHRPRSVMIVGASGSGKSSLARAGVIPLLTQSSMISGASFWRRAIMKPSDSKNDLFHALAIALLQEIAIPEISEDRTTSEILAERLRSSPSAAIEIIRGGLRSAAEKERNRRLNAIKDEADEFATRGYYNDESIRRQTLSTGLPLPSGRLILLVDQFEEVFTKRFSAESVQSFTTCLKCLAEQPDSPVFLLMTLSSAFQTEVINDPNLRKIAATDGVYSLAAPTEEEFAQMIRLPAMSAGLQFETIDGVSLDEEILRDARSHPDCLPLVEFCLETLTDRCAGKPTLTFEEYKSLGKISGVLTKRANETLNKLTPSQQRAIDVVLPALINRDPNQSHAAVRRTATWQEISASPDSEALVAAFVQARLLVVDRNDAGERSVSVVHEALLRHWEPAKRWIGLDENQDFLRRRERLEQSFRNWQSCEPSLKRGFLLPAGIQLVEAQDLLKHHPQAFGLMADYIRQSAWEWKKRRARLYGMAAAVVLLGFSLYLVYISQRFRDVQANQLLAKAEHDLFLKDFASAEITAAKAITLRDNLAARRILLHAKSGGIHAVTSSHLDQGSTAGLSTISRDGEYCATVNTDATRKLPWVSLVDLNSLNKIAEFEIKEAPECLAFSHEQNGNRWLALAWPDTTVGIWQLTSAGTLTHLCDIAPKDGEKGRPKKRIPAMVFHPTEPWIAVCSDDKRLCLWDYSKATPELLWERLEAHGTAVHGIAFNYDGSLLASGGGDYVVKVWEIQKALRSNSDDESFAPLYKLEGHTDSVFTVAFSQDGTKLASGGYDRIIRIWDLNNVIQSHATVLKQSAPNDENHETSNLELAHPTLATLNGHSGTVLDVTFSPDGTMVMSGSNDQTARLWHVTGGGALITTFTPNCGTIKSVAVKSFDRNLAFAGEHGWSVWSANGGDACVRLWNGGATIGAVAFDSKEGYLAAGGEDGMVRVWSRDYKTSRTLDPQLDGEYINGIAFSPDGRWLAAGGEGHVIHVWDRQDNWQISSNPTNETPTLAHDGPVWGLCFAPDSAWLASSNADKDICIRRWDARNNWQLLNHTQPMEDAIYALGVDPKGQWLVSGDSEAVVAVREVNQLDSLSSSLITSEQGETNIWSVSVCPEPLAVYAAGSDGHVYRWVPGSPVQAVRTSDEDANVNHVINSISYSPQLGLVAAAGDGNSVEVYDRDLHKTISFPGHDGTIWMVAFDNAGERLCYGGSDRIIRIWDMTKVRQILETADPDELYAQSQIVTGLTVEDDKVVPRIHDH